MAQRTSENTSKPSAKQRPKRTREQFESSLSLDQADDRFRDIFENHGFGDLGHEPRRLLVRFYQLLLEDQKRHNSTRLHTIHEVAIKHFIDSLMVARLTRLSFPLLDVGTGPGFPGVPLKIIFPKEKIILAEGVQKRVDFLKRVREELNLNNLDIVGRKINNEFALPVQGVITRAFNGGDMGETLEAVQTALQPGGHMVFMKGPGCDGELRLAIQKFSSSYKLIQDLRYSLPKTQHDRRLVIFEKLGALQ